jgi:hypothetical protein
MTNTPSAGVAGTSLRVAFATMHGKERVVAPVFEAVLGWTLEIADIDTDRFGTFSGEVERVAPAHNTVLSKARAGATFPGRQLGLASEGSLGPHPTIPFIEADVELMALVDVERGLDLVVSHIGAPIVSYREVWTPTTDLEAVCSKADLPHHALIVKKGTPGSLWVRKGLREKHDVEAAVLEALSVGPDGDLVIESDYRAMMSPSRMRNIGDCAAKLVERLATPCPSCGMWGWGAVDVERGLPCRACGVVSGEAVRNDIMACVSCAHTVTTSRQQTSIDPAYCGVCNP